MANIGGMTVMKHAVQLFRFAGIHYIVMVFGHRWDAMGNKLRHLPAKFVVNENYS